MNRGKSAASLAVVLALAIVTAPARAATLAAERELTLDDALALAKKRNKSLVAERARVAQAQTNLSSAWARLLPTIAAQGKYTRNNAEFIFRRADSIEPMTPMAMGMTRPLLIQPINQLDGVISFNAPLIVPAAYPGLQSVKASIAAAEANFDLSETSCCSASRRRSTRRRSPTRCWSRAGPASTSRARRSRTPRRACRRARSPRWTSTAPSSRCCAPSRWSARRATGREQAYRALATLIQIEGPFRAKAPAALAVAAAAAGPGHGAQAASRVPRAGAVGDRPPICRRRPTRGGGRRRSPRSETRASSTTTTSPAIDYSWAIGVQLDWVLYDGGARDAERHLANAQEEESRARAEVLRDNIRDDLANGRSLVDTKLQAVSAATRSVELARETIELVRTQYEAGTVTQVDLLAGAGRPGRRAGGAGAGPLRSGGRRFDAAQDRRHLPAPLNGR